MREITPALTDEIQAHVKGSPVAKADAYPVSTFRQLMGQAAKLAYLNKDYVMFFRGQATDYRNKAGSSTFYPSLYRDPILPIREVIYRFDRLAQAHKQLAAEFDRHKIMGHDEVRRKRYIAWSILQHYEVLQTPFLDLTHSVRVACSFAQLNNTGDKAYVYVFALPHVTNRISINSEHDLVNVRLLSICPPPTPCAPTTKTGISQQPKT